MPNDAKLGLVVGVALVLTVAVVFFRKEAAADSPADTSVKTSPANTTPTPPRPALARAARRPAATATPQESPGRKHVVREGETLVSLAQRYYGDGEQFHLIYRANQQEVEATDPLPPGAVLVIPDMQRQPVRHDEEE